MSSNATPATSNAAPATSNAAPATSNAAPTTTTPAISTTATILTPPSLSPTLQILPPIAPFQPTGDAPPKIWLLHPGYPDLENRLLVLPCFDSRGLHHETARIACCILAGSRWDGHLSLARDGVPVALRPDDILTARSYYFCVPDDPRYPVVPSFDHFRFPDTLPASWLQDKAPILPGPRDTNHCHITGAPIPLEDAHIIPAKNVDWWRQNTMYDHASDPQNAVDTHHAENLVRLRKDVHYLWDAHHLALVPKQGVWVVHVLHSGAAAVNLSTEYHNQQLQPVAAVCRQYLLARFAMAVFSKSLFISQLMQGQRRLLYIAVPGAPPQVQDFTTPQTQSMFGMPAPRGKSSSRSPSKRARAASPEDGDQGLGSQDVDASYHDDASTCCGDGDLDSDVGGRCRATDPNNARGCASFRHVDDAGVDDMDDAERGRPRKRIRIHASP